MKFSLFFYSTGVNPKETLVASMGSSQQTLSSYNRYLSSKIYSLA